jgi:hypothetical protein
MNDWWSSDPVAGGGETPDPPQGWWSSDPVKPAFGSDDYVQHLAKRHDVDPQYVRGLVDAHQSGEALKGTPIAGGFIEKAGAGMSALAQPLTGAGASGGSISERYAKNLNLENEIYSDFERERPLQSAALQFGGGMLTTGALGGTALGARALGAVEGGLARQMGASALSGTLIGGADAAARGNDVGTGAGIGGIAGAAGPLAGRALGAAWDTGSRLWRGGTPSTVPQNVARVGGVNVPLSSGQATGDVATQQFERGALQNAVGQPAQRVAEDFFNGLQQPAVEQARANIGAGFGGGQVAADNPQAAAELVGERIRGLEQQSRQNYNDLYEQFRRHPGEVSADALEGIGEDIRGGLTNRRNPVVIDDVTTPVASRAIQDIDNTISQLRIQNRANPFGQPAPDSIVGVSMQGIDQVRKHLTSMASAAERGSADQRAVRAVIGEFDNHIESAISNGLFTGDDRALDALRAARAAYSQHQRLFTSQGPGDDVGRAMERIVGRNGGDGATPTEVANWLYGSAKVGGTGLSVRLAQRMQGLLGENSPEWAAVRQGLWSRLTQSPEGVTNFGPARIASRIGEFLSGSGTPLAQTMFSPAERRQMTNFMSLQRQIEPRPGTVNTSNTAPMLRMLALQSLRGVMAAIGDSVAGPVGAIAGWSANSAARALGERSTAGRVARSLYQTPAQQQTEDRFVQQMGRYGALASRMITPHPDGQPRDFHPSTIGARQAGDGQHYLPDPTRQGKYLKVAW